MTAASIGTPPPAVHRDSAGSTAEPTAERVAAVRTSGWWRIIIVVGPVVALFVATFGTAGLSWLILGSGSDEVSDAVSTAFVLLQSLVVCGLSIGLAALLARVHRLRLRDLGLRWTRASGSRLLLGVAVGAGVVLLVGLPLTGAGLLRTGEHVDLVWWAVLVAGFAQAFLLQGLPEELLFRGYQMTALRWRPVPALVLSSAVFAAIHLISSGGQQDAWERVVYLAMPFGFAFAAGALMMVTRSLWAAVGVHTGLHLGFLAGQFVGLGDGPVLWATCGGLWVAVGAAVLLLARRRRVLAPRWTGPTAPAADGSRPQDQVGPSSRAEGR